MGIFHYKKTEENEIEFFPDNDKEIIWNGIMYLYGIDLREKPDEYLHSLVNIKEKDQELFNKAP